VYTTKGGRLNYTVGGEVVTLQHLDRPLYLVGYLPKENRIYLIDRDFALVSYQVSKTKITKQSTSPTKHTHPHTQTLYLVGYLPKENRIYLIDRDFALVHTRYVL